MRAKHGLIVAVVLTQVMGFAHADDAGSCYSISDPEARAWCRAKAHNDSSACYSIQRSDLRAQCLAEVRR